MSIDILYFPQKRFHIGCILMKLHYQSFNPIELQLRTEIFYKREPDKFIVNIGMKMEDIHFYRTFGTMYFYWKNGRYFSRAMEEFLNIAKGDAKPA